MVFLQTLLLAVSLLTSMQELFREYGFQRNAQSLYERQAYPAAEKAFERVATLNNRDPETQSTAQFNQACALYMQGKFYDSATLFATSAKQGRTNRELRHKAIFNEGNALAMIAVASSAKSEKITLFRQSLNRFKTALLTNPDDGDAKINYEVVRRYLTELETPEKGGSSPQEQKKNSPAPSSGINNSVASRLLNNAQQQESSLMRKLPRATSSSGQGNKNTKDW